MKKIKFILIKISEWLKRIGRADEVCSGALRRNEAVAELWKACVRLQGALRKRKQEKQCKPK